MDDFLSMSTISLRNRASKNKQAVNSKCDGTNDLMESIKDPKLRAGLKPVNIGYAVLSIMYRILAKRDCKVFRLFFSKKSAQY